MNMTKLPVFCYFLAIFAIFAAVSAESKNTPEELLSSDQNAANNTDALDGNLTIEEQLLDEDEKNNVTTSSQVHTSSAKPTTTLSPASSTTKKSGKPRAPSFAGWSFFIGIIVAFLIIGIAVFVVKFFYQKRRPANTVPYTAYQ
uniref:Syndecan n=2 Tax=Caenorhabditis japonica TaxID=281687 RepID=A0A8R1DHN6_CAEJA